MKSSTKPPSAADKAVEIQFVQFHEPALEAGDYRVSVAQAVSGTAITSESFQATDRYLSVRGPRFALTPSDVVTVFPPPASLGDHSLVLPHVLLSRSTLPWERQTGAPAQEKEQVPWLALLVFDGDEAPATQVVPSSTLINGPNAPQEAFLMPETGDEANDTTLVIDVPEALFTSILPTVEELAYLSHVRRGIDGSGKVLSERAAVVANRLPKVGGQTTVHLVSLEARYNGTSFDLAKGTAKGSDGSTAVRLISLKSWSFSCPPAGPDFRHLLQQLHGDLLVLPKTSLAALESAIDERRRAGFVPLPHSIRPNLFSSDHGQPKETLTYSWYHGPLRPGDTSKAASELATLLPASCADALLLYDEPSGMFDASYAAAWELGRLLGLASRSFSVELYRYKCAYGRYLAALSQTTHPELPPPRVQQQEPPLSETVSNWLNENCLLGGVPFAYLVPDDAMLPVESIRFFKLDTAWVNCLVAGALSLGQIRPAGANGGDMPPTLAAWTMGVSDVVSGFLLRSEVVSGWPNLQVDAYPHPSTSAVIGPAGTTLPLLRMERLSPSALLCLFQGDIAKLEIHQKPETLHFGFEVDAEGAPEKELRDPATGETIPGKKLQPIPMRTGSPDASVVDVSTLAEDLARATSSTSFSAAQFALQMIVGVEKVVFYVSKPGP